MAEDRFANVFTGELKLTGANTLSFAEMNFGITLRDRVALIIDQLYWYLSAASIAEMTATGDRIIAGLCVSDQVADMEDIADRRILVGLTFTRHDFGTAAAAGFIQTPIVQEFSPPLIVLPNRFFIGGSSSGLASALTIQVRMHFRTVSITQDQQLVEVLEAFQLST